MRGEEVQKIPLRHERDEFAPHRQMPAIRAVHNVAFDGKFQAGELLMRQAEKFFDNSSSCKSSIVDG